MMVEEAETGSGVVAALSALDSCGRVAGSTVIEQVSLRSIDGKPHPSCEIDDYFTVS